MAETLHYRFKEDTNRGTPLEISGPKTLIDEVISSTRGPLFYDVTAKAAHRSVMGMIHDGEGSVTLDFDMNTNGRSYFQGSAADRSRTTLAIIAQLDGYARRHDAGDPRISFDQTVEQKHELGYVDFGRDFAVSFERPNGTMEDLLKNMNDAMVRAADIVHLYSTVDHSNNVAVLPVGPDGLDVRMGLYGPGQRVATVYPGIALDARRLELIGKKECSHEERLVIFLGAVATLPDIAA